MHAPDSIRTRLTRCRRRGASSLARAAAVSLAALLAACSSVRLVPVASADGREAQAATSSVEVRANADKSQRLWTVPHAFTPVRISVRNTGDAPIYVDLEDIQLAGVGAALRPVPPASIPPRRRVGSLGLDPGSPFVAPQIGNSVYGRSESLVLGPPLGSQLALASHAREGAGAEILASAFSGGPIKQGETRTGIVYFRHVPHDVEHLTLRVGVRPDRRQSAPTSVVEIVYAVQI